MLNWLSQEDEGNDFWLKFDQVLRDKIKQDLLALLVDEIPSVVKDAGICLGSIATVECPVG